MAADVIERPSDTVTTVPNFFDVFKTDDTEELGGDANFPDAVIMISLGGGKYAAVNVTTVGPDPMTVGCIACFASETEVDMWESQWKLTGERVTKEFQEAREIAVSKPNIYGLALQVGANTAHIHWVR